MYVVRETFTARPGMASKLARLIKDAMAPEAGAKVRVLTDTVGAFNTVVMETEVASMGDFEKRLREYADRKDLHERMKGYTDLYATGRREIYQVV